MQSRNNYTMIVLYKLSCYCKSRMLHDIIKNKLLFENNINGIL